MARTPDIVYLVYSQNILNNTKCYDTMCILSVRVYQAYTLVYVYLKYSNTIDKQSDPIRLVYQNQNQNQNNFISEI